MRNEVLMLLYIDQKNTEQDNTFTHINSNNLEKDILYHSSAADKVYKHIISSNIGINTNIDVNNNTQTQQQTDFELINAKNNIEIAQTDVNYNGEYHFEKCKINLDNHKSIPSFVIPTSNLCLYYDFSNSYEPNIIAFTIDTICNNQNTQSVSRLYNKKIAVANSFNESDISSIFNNIFTKIINNYTIEKISENNLVSKRVYNFSIHKNVSKIIGFIYGYIIKISDYSYFAYYCVNNICMSVTLLLHIIDNFLNTTFLCVNELITLFFSKYEIEQISDRNAHSQEVLEKVDNHLSFFHRLKKLFLKITLTPQRSMYTFKTNNIFRTFFAYVCGVYDTWKEYIFVVLAFSFILGVTGKSIGLVHAAYIFISSGHLNRFYLSFLNTIDFISKQDYQIRTNDFNLIKHTWLKQKSKHKVLGKKANSISKMLDLTELTPYNTFSVESKYCNNNILITVINPALIHHYLPSKFHVITSNMYPSSSFTKNDFYHYKTQDIAQIAYMLGN